MLQREVIDLDVVDTHTPEPCTNPEQTLLQKQVIDIDLVETKTPEPSSKPEQPLLQRQVQDLDLGDVSKQIQSASAATSQLLAQCQGQIVEKIQGHGGQIQIIFNTNIVNTQTYKRAENMHITNNNGDASSDEDADVVVGDDQ